MFNYYSSSFFFAQNGNCRKTGMWAKLSNEVEFRNNTMKSCWFTGRLIITHFEIDLSNVDIIEDDAFVSPAFETIVTLTLTHLKLTEFSLGTFNGLISLTTLHMYATTSTVFVPGYLASISSTLQTLVVFGKLSDTDVYNLDGLTSGTTMSSLKWIKYALYLRDSITNKTFSGLLNIITIEVSGCGIEVIGAGSFDSVQRTLELLKLNGNNLKTLPPNIFYQLLPRKTLTIYLSDNPWDCNCNLTELQTNLIINAQNFIGDMQCSTPDELSTLSIDSVIFCENGLPLTTTESIELTRTVVICNESFSNQPHRFLMNNPITLFSIQRSINGVVRIKIDTKNVRFSLIWFHITVSNSSDEKYRRTNHQTEVFTEINLQRNLLYRTAYTFCVLNVLSDTVSPFDCKSYYHMKLRSNVWISKSYIGLFLSISISCLIISIILGIVVGIAGFKLYFVKKERIAVPDVAANNSFNYYARWVEFSNICYPLCVKKFYIVILSTLPKKCL